MEIDGQRSDRSEADANESGRREWHSVASTENFLGARKNDAQVV